MRKRVEYHKCYRLFRKRKTLSYFKEIINDFNLKLETIVDEK